MTPEDLLNFEEQIATEFATGSIKSPIHLGGGNERQLIDLFKAIGPDDWCLGSWRAHYLCLLKGVPSSELREAIREGRSVSLCFPKYKILCSGIVGGIAPIAVGIAWSLKQRAATDFVGQHRTPRVFVFCGDMTMESGIVFESMKYATRHRLPVRWICEDNGLSVMTDTQESWGKHIDDRPHITQYSYKLTRPHSGIGSWVRF